MSTFRRTLEAPAAQSGDPGHLSVRVGFLGAFLMDFDLRAEGEGGGGGLDAAPENDG